MPQSFINKLYSETQVSGRLGMSEGISPRHAQNPLSGERRKRSQEPNMPYHPLLTSSSVHHSSHQLTTTFLSYYNVT